MAEGRRKPGRPLIYPELGDADWLRDRHAEGLTLDQIAEQVDINCSRHAVHAALTRHGIVRSTAPKRAPGADTDASGHAGRPPAREVRAWARRMGLPISDRGQIPEGVADRWNEQHPDRMIPPRAWGDLKPWL